MYDQRNPRRFATPRALQIILQLDQQVRYARIQVSICGFPLLLLVEFQLFGLALLGGATGSWNGI